MTVAVRFRWGHLDRLPTCEHGKIEGYCAKCLKPTPGKPHTYHGQPVE